VSNRYSKQETWSVGVLEVLLPPNLKQARIAICIQIPSISWSWEIESSVHCSASSAKEAGKQEDWKMENGYDHHTAIAYL